MFLTGGFKYEGKMAIIMRSDSRRGFLSRAFQISTGAALATVAGCMSSGSGGNGSNRSGTEKLEAIDNISFAGTEMKIGFNEDAVGKTINLIPPNNDERLRHWTVEGDRTSITFSLTESSMQGGVMPISSGEYSLEVVENAEVVNKRTLNLKPDLQLLKTDTPSSPKLFGVNVKLRNRGTLPAGIENISVPSGVPDPGDSGGLWVTRVDSTAHNLRKIVEIGKKATFKFETTGLFAFGSEKKMRNYTVGNSSLSSRKCDENQRQATLHIKTSQGGKIKVPFTYSLSGDVARRGLFYHCGNYSYSFPTNESIITANSTQANGK